MAACVVCCGVVVFIEIRSFRLARVAMRGMQGAMLAAAKSATERVRGCVANLPKWRVKLF